MSSAKNDTKRYCKILIYTTRYYKILQDTTRYYKILNNKSMCYSMYWYIDVLFNWTNSTLLYLYCYCKALHHFLYFHFFNFTVSARIRTHHLVLFFFLCVFFFWLLLANLLVSFNFDRLTSFNLLINLFQQWKKKKKEKTTKTYYLHSNFIHDDSISKHETIITIFVCVLTLCYFILYTLYI